MFQAQEKEETGINCEKIASQICDILLNELEDDTKYGARIVLFPTSDEHSATIEIETMDGFGYTRAYYINLYIGDGEQLYIELVYSEIRYKAEITLSRLMQMIHGSKTIKQFLTKLRNYIKKHYYL